MSIKFKLTVLSFFQFFVWGAWLITIANYWFGTRGWEGAKFGAVFSTMGFASIIMPTLTGIIADRWLNAERLYGLLQILYAAVLFYIPQVDNPDTFFWVMLVAMGFYMPTIALANSISYTALKANGGDVIKDFPPIRVWGTIGFIVAMWMTNLSGSKASPNQFYIAGAAAMFIGIFAFTLPKCPPQKKINRGSSIFQILGLDAFKLFANYKIAVFFIFSMFLGGALQLTNAYGDVFLDEFKHYPSYVDSFVVKYSTIIMSISQISETLFILAIPFFLKRYGIKKVMLISMLAWVLRFALFGVGNPTSGLWMILLSCIVYGMAFDFFNISGSLFVETNTDRKIRSSAQGLFMMMTNGFGAVFGSLTSGWLIDRFFTRSFDNAPGLADFLHTTPSDPRFVAILNDQFKVNVGGDGMLSSIIAVRDWPSIWFTFAAYAMVVAVLFAIFFRHQHQPEQIGRVVH
ncbi:nucleoside permease [Niabella yanshanensis]|uniref:Nucleoside permease n=1 Tax=Niabella yanshanensis TaxID=577386 RepID=A0ABZ0WB61_9BACT|nr:nucleoside permease [Niabella yanshanensis]WQD40179.1 nucleoside permease [Niabella yanshanensis]